MTEMMIEVLTSTPSLTAWGMFFLILSVVSCVAYVRRLRRLSRIRDLQESAKGYEVFIAAYDEIDGDPALPGDAQEVLDVMLFKISDRKFAHFVTAEIASSEPKDSREGSRELQADMEFLRKSRPDLVEGFERAASAALMASILRWPETSHVFKQFVIATLIDREHEYQAVSRIAKSHWRGHDDNSGAGTMGGNTALA